MRELWSDESGVTSVEYALILALVAVVGILAWTNLGGEVAFSANTSADAIANGTGGAPTVWHYWRAPCWRLVSGPGRRP